MRTPATRRWARATAFTFTVATLALAVLPVLAGAASAATRGNDDPESQIVITGSVDVRRGDVIERVLIFDGDVRVDGRVRDWVFAFNGDVTIDGRVSGDVTALNGRVVVTESGSVGGDVVSSDRPVIANRDSVAGDVDRARRRFALGRLGTIGRIVMWIAATVSSFLLGGLLLLVMPRGLEAAARIGRTAVGPAIGLGFAVAIGLPVAGLLLSVTIIGLPLGLATLFALALLFGLAYVTGAYFLGRLILREPRNRLLAFLVGWGILRVVAIVPVLGGLALAAASIYGIGCLTVGVFRARGGGRVLDEGSAPPSAPPSEPTTPTPTEPDPATT
jgi:hypothetical protein